MDKFEFWKLIQSINWPAWLEWSILIDLSGFAIAIIGFFGLAPRIEAYFRNTLEQAEFTEKHMSETIKKVFPLHKNWWKLFLEGVRIILWPFIPALIFAALITGEYKTIWDWFLTTPWQILIALGIATPFAIFLLATFSRILANRLTKYIAWIVWRIVSILAYPPAGVLGTIGLAITLTSLSVKYLN